MTRFEQELSGSLGVFWKRHAEQEIARLEAEYKNGGMKIQDGIASWAPKGTILPKDCIEKAMHSGILKDLIDAEACAAARDEQTSRILEDYRRKKKAFFGSKIEEAECRAAFGAGTTVVDCITGEKIRL